MNSDLIENNKINYEQIIKQHPWIIQRNQKCILSPDSDGLLCGLLMSHYLNWEIAGFYDGKVLCIKNNESVKDCIFLDMEIFRNQVRSLGHHMVLYNTKNKPKNWFNFNNCIQPNNIRDYDAKTKFNLKYPLGAIHLLLSIVGNFIKIEINKKAICPLMYTDGTFKNLFNYPENCLSWLSFLGAENQENPLNKIFFNKDYTTQTLMIALSDFFKKISEIKDGKRGGDKIKISNSYGKPINFLEIKNKIFNIEEETRENAKKFLKILSELIGWKFIEEKWNFNNLKIYQFKKGNIKPSEKRYNELMNKNPLSLAMTSSLALEFTLEEPDKLP